VADARNDRRFGRLDARLAQALLALRRRLLQAGGLGAREPALGDPRPGRQRLRQPEDDQGCRPLGYTQGLERLGLGLAAADGC
jgi:hypothetical protein